MTQIRRYQEGSLSKKHGAWYARYYEHTRINDGSTKSIQRWRKIANVEGYPNKYEVMPLFAKFMQELNSIGCHSNMNATLGEFVETNYFPYVQAKRAPSTTKGYRELWRCHIEKRASDMRLREFRPVHGSKLLEAVFADKPGLSKQTLKNIKFLLSGIFKYARNQGFLDTENPMTGVMIPDEAKGPAKTHAYSLPEILQIMDMLPLQPKAVVAVAAYAGLREGEVRGLDWTDYDFVSGVKSLDVNKSVWRGHLKRPKTLASEDNVPVIKPLAAILDEYRQSMRNPQAGPMFVSDDGSLLDLDKLGTRLIRPAIRTIGMTWHGWHAFRRGIASNLFALGVNEKIVQRILRHSKPHVTKERYIKAFDSDVIAAMRKMEETIAELRSSRETNERQWN